MTEAIAEMTDEVTDLEPEAYSGMTATYSPADNKLRLYSIARLDKETYQRVKDAGFSWAPKQEVFVAPMWTPAREDLLIELCGDIEDEDTTPEERAADRAERFGEYSDNADRRAASAERAVESITDGIPFGQPILVGHHSERHARRDAEKIQRGMRKVVDEMKRSDYWERRAKDCLRHQRYLEAAPVRHRRIKTIEADKRKSERSKADAEKFARAWSRPDLTLEQAKAIANYDHISMCFPLADYPREMPASQYEGPMSLWSALEDGVITPEQAAALAIPAHVRTIEWRNRWIQHYENRLTYERAMLGEQGGIIADRVKPEKGGAVRSWAGPGHGRGWSYIRKVNKVSVTLEDVALYATGDRKFTRTMPLDQLKGIMTKAEVDTARAAGPARFAETAHGDGFFLSDEPVERVATVYEPPAWQAIEEAANSVQAVSAPELFPTPPELAARMVEMAEIEPGHRVLEPSAGTGAILQRIPTNCQRVAVENNFRLGAALSDGYPGVDVLVNDFLVFGNDLGPFDRVVMNPPFSEDTEHVQHAYGMLAPGGMLVAIMSEGPFFRGHKADQAFRLWLEEVDADIERLPADTFKSSGTGVQTRLVKIIKPEVMPIRPAPPEPEPFKLTADTASKARQASMF